MSEQKTQNSVSDKSKWEWQYFLDCMTTKYCCFKGRANRKEFWSFILFYIFSTIAFVFLISTQNPTLSTILPTCWHLAFILPFCGVLTRRLHDINLSGWLLLPLFIVWFSWYLCGIYKTSLLDNDIFSYFSGVLGLILLVCGFIPKKTDNKYGKNLQEDDTGWMNAMFGAIFVPIIIFAIFFEIVKYLFSGYF